MNISHENKLIWWALEETEEKKTYEILKNYGFLVENNENVIKSGLKYDNYVTKSGEFPDYKVICTIKNPYHRVFDLFLEFGLNNRVVKKKFLPILREKFNDFVNKSLVFEKLIVKPIISVENPSPELQYLEKWTFDDKIPDYLIRLEHFSEDYNKIGIFDVLEDKTIENTSSLYDYTTMYDFNTAKKVYHYYKKHFYLCDYDPFSFTQENMTKEEKISFLHDLL